MSYTQHEPWWRAAAVEVWRSVWLRTLAFIFIAFEIYNTAILPAIQGTQNALINQNRIGQSKAEECSAMYKAIVDTVPMDKVGEATRLLRQECGSLVGPTGYRSDK